MSFERFDLCSNISKEGWLKWFIGPKCPDCEGPICRGHMSVSLSRLAALLREQPPAAPPTFAPGDVVRLKSGGPRLVVDEVKTMNEKTLAWCIGFTDAGFVGEWIDTRWLEKAE